MKIYEELARLRVEEAIRRGLEAQRYRLPPAGRDSAEMDLLARSSQGARRRAAAEGGRWRKLMAAVVAGYARLRVALWLENRARPVGRDPWPADSPGRATILHSRK